MDERIYKIALSQLQGIGIVNTKSLVAYTGGLKNLFTYSDQEIAERCELDIKRVRKFNRKKALIRAEQELEFMDANGVQLHYYQDANYPPALKFCEDGPIVLFSKGNVQFNRQNIAVVGTRKLSAYGKELTHSLIKDLTPRSVQIISGLAHGIDKEAHEAALANNLPTIAVLGHGLDLIYPAAHKGLANRMLENGGLVTEFLSKTPGDPGNFPQRNRIVAGLSDATIVIESALTGGSLITANFAWDYNREVFAVPGRVDQPQSAGCNHLIRSQKAHLITCADDMNNAMGWEMELVSEEDHSELFDSMIFEEQQIIQFLRKEKDGLPIDELALAVNLSASELSLHLFNLEMKDVIEPFGGKSYRIK